MTDPISTPLLEYLVERAINWTGFRADAILHTALTGLAEQRLRGCTEAQLEQSIREAEPSLVHDVCQAVSVGETYFFRTPEQFDFISAKVWPRMAGAPRLRIWSAGCATGEETYSLAALFLKLTGETERRLEILGTDLVSRNIEVARQGRYGRWSVRHERQLVPAFHELPDKRIEIDDRLRRVVSFAEHNLLLPLPGSFGSFHLIFCRNVLVYFARETAARALVYLATALAPGGVLVFGSMDVPEVPPGFQRVGPTELQIYERTAARSEIPSTTTSTRVAIDRRERRERLADPDADVRAATTMALQGRGLTTQIRRRDARTRTPAPRAASAERGPLAGPPAEPVALHLRALALIETEDTDGADELLDNLVRRVPDYLPARLERALLHLRLGERASGQRLMREVLDSCRDRPLDEVLAAPAPMTVAFVLASAQASLRGTA